MAFSSHRSRVTCPVCHHTQGAQVGSRVSGLVKCYHCQACLIISWSGHYVRDPLISAQVVSLDRFRRQRLAPRGQSRSRKFNHSAVVIFLSSVILGGLAFSQARELYPHFSINELELPLIREFGSPIEKVGR